MTEQEFLELIKNEEWTHETITDIEVSESKLRYWTTVEVISTCSKLKITHTIMYNHLTCESGYFEADADFYQLEDLQGNEINISDVECTYLTYADKLPSKFTKPDLTELKKHAKSWHSTKTN